MKPRSGPGKRLINKLNDKYWYPIKYKFKKGWEWLQTGAKPPPFVPSTPRNPATEH